MPKGHTPWKRDDLEEEFSVYVKFTLTPRDRRMIAKIRRPDDDGDIVANEEDVQDFVWDCFMDTLSRVQAFGDQGCLTPEEEVEFPDTYPYEEEEK